MKSLAVSEELHEAIKDRSKREGRMISAFVAVALNAALGEDFPQHCREASLLPTQPKGKE